MPEYRLGKVSQEFNRSCLTIADLLKSKGYVIDKVNPTLKITEEQYKLCLAEFTKNNQNNLDSILKKPMLSLTSKNKRKFSMQKFRPEIKKTIICPVCGCSLFDLHYFSIFYFFK